LGIGVAAVGEFERAQEKLAVAIDHGEQIVEVVGDATGEPADGFHLLGLAELVITLAKDRLGAAAFGDVAGIDNDAADGWVGQKVGGETLHRAIRTVLVADAGLKGLGGAGTVADFAQELESGMSLVGMEQVGDGLSDEPFGGGAEDAA